MRNHQCTLALTGMKATPYRAECWCGWTSDPYPHTKYAAIVATEHCQTMNKGMTNG